MVPGPLNSTIIRAALKRLLKKLELAGAVLDAAMVEKEINKLVDAQNVIILL